MAAVKSRRRRGTTKDKPTGKELYQIIGPDGSILGENPYSEGSALIRAQKIAEQSPEEVTLIVRVKTLFGEPDDLFRVVREEDGSVSTYRA